MINKYSYINIYEHKKKSSKLSSQILYGEKFTILKEYKDWYKIKTSYDKYVGFIKKKKMQNLISQKDKFIGTFIGLSLDDACGKIHGDF